MCITAKNYEIDLDAKFVPPVYRYIVHPDEHENMERYLAGTDDPIYDFIHYQVSEVAKAAEDFESEQKKLKLG